MKLKRLIFTLIPAFLMVVSCTPKIPLINTPTETKPSSNVSIVNLPQEPQTTLAPTQQLTLTPQLQSNCTDSASFVTDVTVPDNTTLKQGENFIKTWRIRNTGTCTWNTNYSMIFVNGDQMNSIASIPFNVTPPSATLDISVNLVAPSADGAYTGNYELHNDSGQTILIDNTKLIWVKITVGSKNSQQPNPTSPTASGTPTPVAATSGDCTFFEDSLLENQLINLINSARVANGLQALVFNKKLSGAAIGHSIDMACHSIISHTGTNGSSITDRFTANGYSYTYWNEAIFAEPPEYGGNAQAAVDWWLNDPSHRVILLSPDAKDIGAGYAYVAGSKLGGYYTVDIGAH